LFVADETTVDDCDPDKWWCPAHARL